MLWEKANLFLVIQNPGIARASQNIRVYTKFFSPSFFFSLGLFFGRISLYSFLFLSIFIPSSFASIGNKKNL